MLTMKTLFEHFTKKNRKKTPSNPTMVRVEKVNKRKGNKLYTSNGKDMKIFLRVGWINKI